MNDNTKDVNLNDNEALANSSDEKEFLRTVNDLTYEQAGGMVQNYKGWAGKDPSGKKQNTRSVWFSLEVLENLVDQLKAERDERMQSQPDKVTDGVRIYLSRYVTTHPKHPERNTLVFVSTYGANGGQYHQDYFNTPPIQNLKSAKGIDTDPLNNGELSPPNTLGLSWESDQG